MESEAKALKWFEKTGPYRLMPEGSVRFFIVGPEDSRLPRTFEKQEAEGICYWMNEAYAFGYKATTPSKPCLSCEAAEDMAKIGLVPDNAPSSADRVLCYDHKVVPEEVPTYWLKDHCPDCLRAELAATNKDREQMQTKINESEQWLSNNNFKTFDEAELLKTVPVYFGQAKRDLLARAKKAEAELAHVIERLKAREQFVLDHEKCGEELAQAKVRLESLAEWIKRQEENEAALGLARKGLVRARAALMVAATEKAHGHQELSKCGHNRYWTEASGTCFACDNENVQKEMDAATARVEALEKALNPADEFIFRMEQAYEVDAFIVRNIIDHFTRPILAALHPGEGGVK